MVCPRDLATAGGALGAFALLNAIGLIAFLGLLRHVEKKERRALKTQADEHRKLEEKTVVVENKGPVAGQAGVAQVVTSGPQGSTTATVPASADGTAVVSTSSAGVPGTVAVDQGQTVAVTAQHPPGEPEKAVVVKKTTTGPTPN